MNAPAALNPAWIVAAAVVVAAVGWVALRASSRRPPAPPALLDREQAGRLARAIAADIALYHAEDVARARASGAPAAGLTAAIEEGRALFQQRVAVPFHGLYDDAIHQQVLRAP